jgi:hypothetical protein
MDDGEGSVGQIEQAGTWNWKRSVVIWLERKVQVHIKLGEEVEMADGRIAEQSHEKVAEPRPAGGRPACWVVASRAEGAAVLVPARSLSPLPSSRGQTAGLLAY